MSRGLLPRTFDLDELDSGYKDSHLYDSALAVIATIGANKNNLAHEIVMGIIESQSSTWDVPVVVDGEDATSSTPYAKNNGVTMAAYALGYYLELYPSTPDGCLIVDTLRKMLHYLETERYFIYQAGLITAGMDATGTNLPQVYTEDNLIGYFAFKQAGLLLNEPNYTTTANELSDALQFGLFDGSKFYNGFLADGTTVTGSLLINNVLGSLFYNEIGNTALALALLTNTDNYLVTDSIIGVNGYKATILGSNVVWFEGSYAVALAYAKIGNTAKYKAIIKELNKFIDTTDGGVKGTIKKDNYDESMVGYKAVGSTAWSIIANLLKATVFQVRTTSPAPLSSYCLEPYFNTVQSDTATVSICGSGYLGSTETYTVRAGRYISYVDQASANAIAIADVNANKQAWANYSGTCTGNVGNEEQSDYFFSSVCPSGTSHVAYEYIVPADTYFAGDLATANAMAIADVNFNGQAEADANGICDFTTTSIHLSVFSSVTAWGFNDDVYYEVVSDAPVTDNITIQLSATVNGSTFLLTPTTISNGFDSSGSQFAVSTLPGEGSTVTFNIISVSPSPDALGTTYTY